MKSAASQLVHFLTNPDRTNAEFRALARLILSQDARKCVTAARHLRLTTDTLLRRLALDAASEESTGPSSRYSIKSDLLDEVFSRLRDLLLDEARLTPNQAIAQLSAELPGVKRLNPRTSLRNAVEYFLTVVDGSALLSAAQRVRNRVMHAGSSHAWPLDDKQAP